ncbi:hypothetical protein JOM56_000213 [Amanita muscaria]
MPRSVLNLQEPQRVTTRARNKDVRPGVEAGIAPKPRPVTKAQKAAKKAAEDQAQAEKEAKEAAAIERLAMLEHRNEAEYLLDTPRAAPLQKPSAGRSSRPSRSSNLAPAKTSPAVPPTSPASAPTHLSESGQSGTDFVPQPTSASELDEEEEVTEDPSDVEKVKKGKGRTTQKKKAVQIRAAVKSKKANLIDESNLVTPKARPSAKRTQSVAVSDGENLPHKKARADSSKAGPGTSIAATVLLPNQVSDSEDGESSLLAERGTKPAYKKGKAQSNSVDRDRSQSLTMKATGGHPEGRHDMSEGDDTQVYREHRNDNLSLSPERGYIGPGEEWPAEDSSAPMSARQEVVPLREGRNNDQCMEAIGEGFGIRENNRRESEYHQACETIDETYGSASC